MTSTFMFSPQIPIHVLLLLKLRLLFGAAIAAAAVPVLPNKRDDVPNWNFRGVPESVGWSRMPHVACLAARIIY